jgi:hypothetical protein
VWGLEEVECSRFCRAMRSSSLCSEHPLISLKGEKKWFEKREEEGGEERGRIGRIEKMG